LVAKETDRLIRLSTGVLSTPPSPAVRNHRIAVRLALETVSALHRIPHQKVSHQLALVYRIAIFDSFLNNLTSYTLAARPSNATGSAQMQVSVLLGKTRAEVVNEYIARRTKSLSRENLATRIQALREITDVDFPIAKNDFEELKRLSNLRNAIIHEGSNYQFTVDDQLRIHSQAETQMVEMGVDRFDVINRIAALIYEPYVRQFVGRDLHEIECTTIAALNPPKRDADRVDQSDQNEP